MEHRLYPIFLDLKDKPVLLVGGGEVGGRKALSLLQSGASVTVVAPQVCTAVAEAAAQGSLRWLDRPFRSTDVEGVWLIIAATADPGINAEVARCGAAARCFVNAVDDPTNASAYGAAVLTRGPVTVAFSTGGRAPAMARLLRELVAKIVPEEPELATFMARAEALRDSWRRTGVPIADRYRQLLSELLRVLTTDSAERQLQ